MLGVEDGSPGLLPGGLRRHFSSVQNQRMHVHCYIYAERDSRLNKTSRREGSDVLVKLDVDGMWKDGVVMFKSRGNVLLFPDAVGATYFLSAQVLPGGMELYIRPTKAKSTGRHGPLLGPHMWG